MLSNYANAQTVSPYLTLVYYTTGMVNLNTGISPWKLWFDLPVFQFSHDRKSDAGTGISPTNAVLPLSAFNNHLRHTGVLISP